MLHVPRPAEDRIDFSHFKGTFLEAARAVLFHTTAIVYHHGRDIKNPLFLLWNRCYKFAPNRIQPVKIKKRVNELKCHEKSTQGEEFVATIKLV